MIRVIGKAKFSRLIESIYVFNKDYVQKDVKYEHPLNVCKEADSDGINLDSLAEQ